MTCLEHERERKGANINRITTPAHSSNPVWAGRVDKRQAYALHTSISHLAGASEAHASRQLHRRAQCQPADRKFNLVGDTGLRASETERWLDGPHRETARRFPQFVQVAPAEVVAGTTCPTASFSPSQGLDCAEWPLTACRMKPSGTPRVTHARQIARACWAVMHVLQMNGAGGGGGQGAGRHRPRRRKGAGCLGRLLQVRQLVLHHRIPTT